MNAHEARMVIKGRNMHTLSELTITAL